MQDKEAIFQLKKSLSSKGKIKESNQIFGRYDVLIYFQCNINCMHIKFCSFSWVGKFEFRYSNPPLLGCQVG